jgi:hypothetical protein
MANPNVQNDGGPVIGSVQVVPVIWGNSWPYGQGSPLPGQLLTFLQFFVGASSPNMQMLHEYSTASTQINPGSVVNGRVITAPGTPPTSLSDAQIQTNLQSWISNQTLGFPQPSANTVYMLFLPQSVSVTFQGQTSCTANGFNGYHFSNGNLLYVVIPTCSVPTTTPFSIVLNTLTVVCSHELSEIITDPSGGSGWTDSNTNPRDEIGDICQGTGYPQFQLSPVGTVQTSGGLTFQVQAIWSQTQKNCVFGPPVGFSALDLPTAVFGGQPVSGTLFLSDPVPALPATGATISLSTNNAAATFDSSTVNVLPGTSTAPVTASTVAVAEATVVTAMAKLGAQTVQQSLTVLPPTIATFGYMSASAQGYQYPPNAPQGALTLNVPAPAGGLNVSIVSSEPLLVVPIPDIVPIPAAAVSPGEPFYLQVNPAGVTTPVTLTASVSGSEVSFTFEVLAGGPSNIVVKSLTLSPSTVTGGATSFAHFTLAAAVGPGGGHVTVESSNPTEAPVPATIPLAAGATGGSFQIHTRPLRQPIHIQHSTISVGQDGPPAHAFLTITS